MDESALRTLIATLDKQSVPLHWWLHFWTWMVIIGCAGEMYFVLHAYLDERKLWFNARTTGFVAPPEKPSWMVLILELLSVAAVVIGIAGELNIDFKAGRLESQLRDANSQLVFLLGKEAGDAEVSAEGAAKAASQAEDASEKVRKQAEQLAAELDAEKERHGPRHVTPAQSVCMQAALKGLSNQKIKMTWYRSSPEAYAYTSEIAREFSRITGGTIDSIEDDTFPDRTGILLEFGDQRLWDAAFKALNCLVPSGASKISGGPPGPPDGSNQELQIFVFPDTSRSATPR